MKLEGVAILDKERPWYPEAKIISIDELRERRAAKVAALDPDLAGYALKEDDVVIDHQSGTQHRYQGGRLVLL